MPEISALGWFHTIVGIVALLCGIGTLWRYKEIRSSTRSGQVYLIATLITAATALAIFQHGGFGPAHGLAVMALLALAVGFLSERRRPFGALSRYFQAIAYSATLLFHSVPAVTDALMRLPVGNPIVTSIEDPTLRISYLGLLVVFVLGLLLQLRWLYRQPRLRVPAD